MYCNKIAITKTKAEAEEDISPTASLELEAPAKKNTKKNTKPKPTEKEKRFMRLDEIHDGLYEGESDSEWEDADLFDEEECKEKEKDEHLLILLLIDEAREIKDQMIKDLDDKSPEMAIRSLEKGISNLTLSVAQLKDEVLKAADAGDKDDLKEKKKELAETRKALRKAKASIKEKKEIADCNEIEIEKAKIEAEFARFEVMAEYFDTVDALVEYATSDDDQARSFFGALKCKADLDRSLFFNEAYDVAYVAEDHTASDEKYAKHREDNDMSFPMESVSQLEWDEVYESLGDLDEHMGHLEKLSMNQLKFLCVEFNVPRDGKKLDIVERLKSPYDLYVPKNKRTQPFDTFKTGDPNQEKYDELMKDKSYYKKTDVMKILRQRKIMGCPLMKATKMHVKCIFYELGLKVPKSKQEDLVKILIEHYYELY
jgi:hypothetical protein